MRQFKIFALFFVAFFLAVFFLPQTTFAAIPPEPGQSDCHGDLLGTCRLSGCNGGEVTNSNGYCINPRARCCVSTWSGSGPGTRCINSGGVCINYITCLNQGKNIWGASDCPGGGSVIICCGSNSSGGGYPAPGPGYGYPSPGSGYSYTYPYPYPTPTYTISGQVFVDRNRNYNRDSGESAAQGVTIRLGGRAAGSRTTNSAGNYSFAGLLAGTYSVTVVVPSGYINVSNVQYPNVVVGPNRPGHNFAIVDVYNITGSVFNDINKNTYKDGVETKDWPANISITRSPAFGNLSVNQTNGTYSITDAYAGIYTVTYNTSATPIPAGYFMIFPQNGPPPRHELVIGPSCPQYVNLSAGHRCSGGNLSDAHFAISNSIPWFQTYGFNIRLDEGVTNKIPAAPYYAPYTSVADDVNSANERFSGYYKIVARHSGKTLAVSGASQAYEAQIVQWDDSSNTNHQWSLDPLGNNTYKITARHSGQVMAVLGASMNQSQPIVQAPYANPPQNDEWLVIPLNSRYYKIINIMSGKALDIEGASTANGARLIQYTDTPGSAEQQFELIRM